MLGGAGFVGEATRLVSSARLLLSWQPEFPFPSFAHAHGTSSLVTFPVRCVYGDLFHTGCVTRNGVASGVKPRFDTWFVLFVCLFENNTG